ncbi:MAG: peptidase M10 [Kofleriaceae bacterium]|jgi:serine protease|nr:peptidase M10 [Kofleriaceae bacterium]MBP6837300.1 peptidase M10 [Kofleriaceae bacterium]MBP9202669.1 peptidase M10 [Kofleriaceae bacterium]
MIRTALTLVAAGGLLACATAGDELDGSDPDVPTTFEEFAAQTYRETWDGGLYIVNGDTPILDEKALREFWDELQNRRLIVNTSGGLDTRWNDTQKLNLTYCVNNNFAGNKAAIVEALRQATDLGWETMANVNFVYVPAQDASCTASNPNVVFNVRQVSGQPYLARAFFPNNPRSAREVLVDTSSFSPGGWPVRNILAHELGHALGFRHEHTRPESGTCFEDTAWRPLTPYDSASVMHYPQCNGSSNDLDFTTRDAQGAAALYGAPGGNPPPPPPPPPTGEQTATQSGTLARGANAGAGPYAVRAGTLFTAAITGTGDADLYVRFGAAPTTRRFDCRPYLSSATETCTVTVPAGQSQAYVMVNGYTASTYTLNVRWTAP